MYFILAKAGIPASKEGIPTCVGMVASNNLSFLHYAHSKKWVVTQGDCQTERSPRLIDGQGSLVSLIKRH